MQQQRDAAAAAADDSTQVLVRFVTKLPAEFKVPDNEVVRGRGRAAVCRFGGDRGGDRAAPTR